MLRSAVERAQLGHHQVVAPQCQARPAHAQEGVLFHGQIEVGHLLVAADVQRAHHQRLALQRLGHGAVGLVLVFLIGHGVALEEEEFGAHQAHALGAGLQRLGGLVGAVGVGGDLHRVAVGRGGGLLAGAGLFFLAARQALHALAGFDQRGLARSHVEAPAVAVEDGHGAGQHRRGRIAAAAGQHARAGSHHGGQAQGPRQDGGVRRGAAARGAEAPHAAGVDLRGDGGREIVGQQDGVMRPGSHVGGFMAPAQQVAQHALAHVLQVGRARREGGVCQGALRSHAAGHGMAPGPGGAVALHHLAAHGLQQVGVLQEALVSGEDGGLLCTATSLGVGCQLAQLGQSGSQGAVQRGGFFGDGGEAVFHLQLGALGLHQRAHHQARAGGDAGEGVARGGLPVAQLAAQALGLRLAGGRQFGLPAFLLAQALNGGVQGGERRRRIAALGREAQLRAAPGAQAQQGGHALGVGHRVAAAHVHARLEAAGHAGPFAGGAGMQAVGVVERQLTAEREVFQRGGAGRAARCGGGARGIV